jgi:phosphatidate cytidylyltransferase
MSATRVVTSAVLIPLVFVVLWYLPAGWFTALAVIAAAIGQHELYAMARNRGIRPLEAMGILLGALVIVVEFAGTGAPGFPRAGIVTLLAFCVLAVLVGRLFAPRAVEGALEDTASTLLGIVYVALLFGYQVGIHRLQQGKYWLLFLYLVIWASDTGAFYVGSALGRHRLYEKISPKKSIEGLIGGTIASLIAALLCKLWLVKTLGMIEALLLGAVLALAGTLGDLSESLLKRSAGVKDSGALIPGHGGILDRMDSMLFAAPVLFFYLRMR